MRKLIQDFRFHQGSDKIYLILIQKVCERTSLNGCLTSTIKKAISLLYIDPLVKLILNLTIPNIILIRF